MCGRTACTLAPDDVCNACQYRTKTGKAKKPLWRDPPGSQQYYPSYNVSPGSHTPVLLSSKHYAGDLDGISDRIIQPMMWGMVPSWHKGDPKKVSYETNNCRAEGMLEKRTFKVPLEKGRRCVVLADGFYEWKRDKDQKQPYFIYFPKSSKCMKKEASEIKQEIKSEEPDQSDRKTVSGHDSMVNVCDEGRKPEHKIKTEIKIEPRDLYENVAHNSITSGHNDENNTYPLYNDKAGDENEEKYGTDNNGKAEKHLLTMAGVFDIWNPPDGSSPLYSYSIITVASSSAMDWLHHRMPAILTSDQEIEDWLEFGDVPLSKAVKSIRPVECIQLHPVSSVVNNSRNKTPDCVEPIDLTKPKKSASSSLMMSWLSKPKKESSFSPVKVTESPPKKKKRTESSVMMNWLNKAKKDAA